MREEQRHSVEGSTAVCDQSTKTSLTVRDNPSELNGNMGHKKMGTITCRLLTLAAASLSVTNLAYSADRQYNIEIARQPIAEALNKFSQQTGLQVSYFRESLPRELFVGPISGQYTADAAIAELLLPNGLSFTQPNDRTIVVLGATAAAPRHKSISADVGSVALDRKSVV